MQVVENILQQAHQKLLQANIFFGHGFDDAWAEAVALVITVLDLPDENSDAVLQQTVSLAQEAKINQLLERRISEKVPLAYLIQKAWFMGLPFYVDERVLIPRSPFAEWIQQRFEPWINPEHVNALLEIGTGSGCMAVAAALAFPDARVDAVDIDPQALAVAKINIAHYGLKDRIQLFEGDCFEPLPKHTVYDIIFTNPPYVSNSEMETLPPEYLHEPTHALKADHAGLKIIQDILKQAPLYLKQQGILVGEVGNTKETLIAAYPDVPFVWLEQEHGGEGLFLIECADLEKYHDQF